MSGRAPASPRVTVRGHCPARPEAVAALVARGRAASLTALPGDFVIVAEETGRTTLISSRSGAVGHFYDTRVPRAHGACLDEVLTAAGRPLRWDHGAVADHLVFGHPLGEATLDRDIRRVPAGSVVVLTRSGGEIRASRPADAPVATPDAALAAFVASVRRAADGGCALSMSGGLDARLLLAALLADGHRPRLLIAGVPGSFDRMVATAVARDLGLRHTVHAVTAARLPYGAARVARATDGLLPLSNWAGMAHLAEDPSPEPALLGYHGELARGYYLPAAVRSAAALARRPAAHAPAHLLGRSGDPFRKAEHARLAPGLSAALGREALEERVRAVLPATGTLLGATEAFFRAQYGRRKIGANLAAIGEFTAWRVPFLDPDWADAAGALPGRWKLGDRWHRWAIGRLWPRLLDYPEEGYGRRTAPRPSPRHWLAGPGRPRTPYYADQRPLLGPGPVMDFLGRHAGHGLGDLLDPALAGELIAEQMSGAPRPHLCFALGALSCWRRSAGP
ncbi:asparagine synthetase B family protein [Streptomyces specialis]|uniref:hypothetical protein n=1 Tax=Streptomyces specialis TaxID=498367 RepID=UPI00073E6CFE|nr:hypothetical protein [Streptomyces specialis]